MSHFTTKVCDLVIPVGEQYSPVMQGEFTTQEARSISIIAAPNVSDAMPYQIQICSKPQAVSTDVFADLYDVNDNPVLAPVAGRAKEYLFPAWPSWRIKAGAAVSYDTSFGIHKSHS